jgi:hypothetical protein
MPVASYRSNRFAWRTAAALFLAVVAVAASARAGAAATPIPLFEPSASAAGTLAVSPPSAARPTVLREQAVSVRWDRLGREGVAGAEALALNLFSDVTVTALRDRVDQRGAGGYSWFGRIDGAPEGSVILVVNGALITGNVWTAAATYEIRPTFGGGHVIREIDQSAYPKESCDRFPSATSPASSLAPTVPDGPAPALLAACLDDPTIDVLVVYNAAAAGESPDIGSEIQLAIDDTNQSYANSGIGQKVRLVHAEQTTYAESGDLETDVNRLQNGGDGYMDGVPGLRDTYGADLVALWLHAGGDFCGRAYDIMNPVSSGFASSAYCTVVRGCAVGNHSFAHELGHLMAARHDWYVDSTNNSPYSYNHGYIYKAGRWRTVMAYNDDCKASGYDCTRLQYWSNPDLQYGGNAMGVAEGSSNASDNRKTLNNSASTVRDFRIARTPRAKAGAPQTVECNQANAGTATLDGSGSCDPNGDSLSYSWTGPFGAASGATPTVTIPYPAGAITLTVNDGARTSLPDGTTVAVMDTIAPSGAITAPSSGICTAGPVTVQDSFTDICDPSPSRVYAPGPGPTYSANGDYHVTLTVTDFAGHSSQAGVSFTIDQTPPTVAILAPPPNTWITPSSIPMSLLFQSSDSDAASGGVVHEVLKLQGCVAYDGNTYGNGNGLLSDESISFTQAELCRISALCGFTTLTQPEIRVESTDCAGNVGVASERLNGSIKLRPGICGP